MTDQLRDEIDRRLGWTADPARATAWDEAVSAAMTVLPGYVRKLMDSADRLRQERDEVKRRLTESQLDLLDRGKEIDRLRREVAFEANGITHGKSAWPRPLCACVTDEQAAALGSGFSRPVCAVHPDRPARGVELDPATWQPYPNGEPR